MSERKTAGTTSGNPFLSPDMFAFPFVVAKTAFDMGLAASLSVARIAQVAVQSADTGLAKYIELTEQELKRGQRRESVKVE